MAEPTGAESLLLESLGLPFLSFVLNGDDETTMKRLQDGTRLSPAQESALEALVTFLGMIPRENPFSMAISLAALGEYNDALDGSWASSTRLSLGGGIDLPAATDPLSAGLLAFIRDTYPLFLLPAEEEPFGLGRLNVSAPLLKHPQRPSFDKAVMADLKLAQLFPEEDVNSGRHGSIYRSTGSGGTIQLVLFAEVLLRNGWQFATRDRESASLRHFADETLKLLDLARDAIHRETVAVPALIGIAGIRIPGGTSISLPWGVVREAQDFDKKRVPSGLEGKLGMTTQEGVNVEIEYSGNLVMELDVPYRLKLGHTELSAAWPVGPLSHEIVARYIETLTLALLLSWDTALRPIIVSTWMSFLDPLAFGVSVSWRDARRLPSLIPTALTASQVQTWSEWIERVHESRIANIDIAVRRTLQAAVERADPTDGFIDAVIAWENMFGSGQGEPTLRISSAMAWLLGKNAADREDIRKQVAGLYELRSRVVHGGSVLNPLEAVERRNEALEIALKALRAMFGDRPELLSDCKNSTERSIRLILDIGTEEDPA